MKEFTLVESAMQEIVQALLTTPMNGNYRVTIERVKRTRTNKQNNSAHLYFTQVAATLNDGGVGQRAFLNKFKTEFDVPNTAHSIKDAFRSIAGTLTGTQETHRLTTTEMQYVYEVFSKVMAERHGVDIPWPSNEAPLLMERHIG